MVQTLSKTAFKPQVLAWLRRVEQTGEEVVITDRGRPVARILPWREPVSDAAEKVGKWQRRAAEKGLSYSLSDFTEGLPRDVWGVMGEEP